MRRVWDNLEDATSIWKEITVERRSTSRDTVLDKRDTVRMGGIGQESRYPARSP